MRIRNLFLLGVLSLAGAVYAGNEGGGGGDANEARVNQIREDIYNWIQKGGSSGLILPSGFSLDHYNFEMSNILQPKKVIISFVENDNSENEELLVSVDGKPKTCRGFFSAVDNRPNIVCNISRFENTKEADQYRLIHHEYAGLVRLEQNDGAASDYEISNQLTDFLKPLISLRLSLKPNNHSSLDELPITLLPPGTKIKSMMDIHILPMRAALIIQDGKIVTKPENFRNGQAACHIYIDPSENDRIVKAGKVFNLSKFKSSLSDYFTEAEMNGLNVFSSIGCASEANTTNGGYTSISKRVPTIAEFKAVITGLFELILPAQEEI